MITLDERDMVPGVNTLGSMLARHINRINNRRVLNQMNNMNPIGMNNNIINPYVINNNMNMMNPIGRNNNIIMNPNGINNYMNRMNPIGMNNNINFIGNQNIYSENEIDTKDKYLKDFFNFISFENKEKYEFKGTKLIINYYNLKKLDVFIDLNLKVVEIISNIYWQLFYSLFKKQEHKRTESNQTTEYVIKTPIYIMDKEACPIQYSNFLYLEYNNNDMQIYADDTGKKIGLKGNSEIFLKIKEEFYNDIIKYPKIPVPLYFQTEYISVEKEFPLNKGGITLENISKLINTKNYRLDVEIGGITANVQIITENCDLSVHKRLLGGGGPPLPFVDVEKGKIKNLNFSKNAPKWRKVGKGLNIFGICNNSKCEAYKKEVVYMTVLTKDGLIFNLNEKVADIRCPMCKKIIKAKTCGFYDCEYQFIGKKIVDGEVIKYDSKTRETMGNNFEYFHGLENGEIIWTELNIYVLPRQSIKYLPN